MKPQLSLLVHHSMASIVPASIADYAVHFASEIIYYLPLPFITPLATDYGIRRHVPPYDDRCAVKMGLKPTQIARLTAKAQYIKNPLHWKGDDTRLVHLYPVEVQTTTFGTTPIAGAPHQCYNAQKSSAGDEEGQQ
jgi:hypothetical protein